MECDEFMKRLHGTVCYACYHVISVVSMVCDYDW